MRDRPDSSDRGGAHRTPPGVRCLGKRGLERYSALVRAEEHVPDEWFRPSPRLRQVRRLQVAGATLAAAAAAAVVAAIVLGAWPAVIAAGAGVVAGAVAERFAQRRVQAWAYCEREDDLLVRRGVLFTRLSVVPYGRMQFVDVTAGPVERSFGLATVRMHTAAAASDARIPGLSTADASRLRDQLAALGEAKAAGL
jgi:membrane protein YdbS with pleckstrin-like domain